MRSLLKCLCGSTWPAENSKDSGAVEREDGTAHVPGDVRVLADQQLQEPPPQTREAREEHDGFHGLASSPGRGDGAAGRSEVSLHAMGLEGLRPVAEDEAVAVCEEGVLPYLASDPHGRQQQQQLQNQPALHHHTARHPAPFLSPQPQLPHDQSPRAMRRISAPQGAILHPPQPSDPSSSASSSLPAPVAVVSGDSSANFTPTQIAPARRSLSLHPAPAAQSHASSSPTQLPSPLFDPAAALPAGHGMAAVLGPASGDVGRRDGGPAAAPAGQEVRPRSPGRHPAAPGPRLSPSGGSWAPGHSGSGTTNWVAVVPFPSSSGSSLGPLPSHSHGVLPPSPLLPPGPGLGLAPKSPHLSTTMRHDFMTLLRQASQRGSAAGGGAPSHPHPHAHGPSSAQLYPAPASSTSARQGPNSLLPTTPTSEHVARMLHAPVLSPHGGGAGGLEGRYASMGQIMPGGQLADTRSEAGPIGQGMAAGLQHRSRQRRASTTDTGPHSTPIVPVSAGAAAAAAAGVVGARAASAAHVPFLTYRCGSSSDVSAQAELPPEASAIAPDASASPASYDEGRMAAGAAALRTPRPERAHGEGSGGGAGTPAVRVSTSSPLGALRQASSTLPPSPLRPRMAPGLHHQHYQQQGSPVSSPLPSGAHAQTQGSVPSPSTLQPQLQPQPTTHIQAQQLQQQLRDASRTIPWVAASPFVAPGPAQSPPGRPYNSTTLASDSGPMEQQYIDCTRYTVTALPAAAASLGLSTAPSMEELYISQHMVSQLRVQLHSLGPGQGVAQQQQQQQGREAQEQGLQQQQEQEGAQGVQQPPAGGGGARGAGSSTSGGVGSISATDLSAVGPGGAAAAVLHGLQGAQAGRSHSEEQQQQQRQAQLRAGHLAPLRGAWARVPLPPCPDDGPPTPTAAPAITAGARQGATAFATTSEGHGDPLLSPRVSMGGARKALGRRSSLLGPGPHNAEEAGPSPGPGAGAETSRAAAWGLRSLVGPHVLSTGTSSDVSPFCAAASPVVAAAAAKGMGTTVNTAGGVLVELAPAAARHSSSSRGTTVTTTHTGIVTAFNSNIAWPSGTGSRADLRTAQRSGLAGRMEVEGQRLHEQRGDQHLHLRDHGYGDVDSGDEYAGPAAAGGGGMDGQLQLRPDAPAASLATASLILQNLLDRQALPDQAADVAHGAGASSGMAGGAASGPGSALARERSRQQGFGRAHGVLGSAGARVLSELEGDGSAEGSGLSGVGASRGRENGLSVAAASAVARSEAEQPRLLLQPAVAGLRASPGIEAGFHAAPPAEAAAAAAVFGPVNAIVPRSPLLASPGLPAATALSPGRREYAADSGARPGAMNPELGFTSPSLLSPTVQHQHAHTVYGNTAASTATARRTDTPDSPMPPTMSTPLSTTQLSPVGALPSHTHSRPQSQSQSLSTTARSAASGATGLMVTSERPDPWAMLLSGVTQQAAGGGGGGDSGRRRRASVETVHGMPPYGSPSPSPSTTGCGEDGVAPVTGGSSTPMLQPAGSAGAISGAGSSVGLVPYPPQHLHPHHPARTLQLAGSPYPATLLSSPSGHGYSHHGGSAGLEFRDMLMRSTPPPPTGGLATETSPASPSPTPRSLDRPMGPPHLPAAPTVAFAHSLLQNSASLGSMQASQALAAEPSSISTQGPLPLPMPLPTALPVHATLTHATHGSARPAHRHASFGRSSTPRTDASGALRPSVGGNTAAGAAPSESSASLSYTGMSYNGAPPGSSLLSSHPYGWGFSRQGTTMSRQGTASGPWRDAVTVAQQALGNVSDNSASGVTGACAALARNYAAAYTPVGTGGAVTGDRRTASPVASPAKDGEGSSPAGDGKGAGTGVGTGKAAGLDVGSFGSVEEGSFGLQRGGLGPLGTIVSGVSHASGSGRASTSSGLVRCDGAAPPAPNSMLSLAGFAGAGEHGTASAVASHSGGGGERDRDRDAENSGSSCMIDASGTGRRGAAVARAGEARKAPTAAAAGSGAPAAASPARVLQPPPPASPVMPAPRPFVMSYKTVSPFLTAESNSNQPGHGVPYAQGSAWTAAPGQAQQWAQDLEAQSQRFPPMMDSASASRVHVTYAHVPHTLPELPEGGSTPVEAPSGQLTQLPVPPAAHEYAPGPTAAGTAAPSAGGGLLLSGVQAVGTVGTSGAVPEPEPDTHASTAPLPVMFALHGDSGSAVGSGSGATPQHHAPQVRLEDGLLPDPLLLLEGLGPLSYITSGAFAAVFRGTWEGVPVGIKFLAATSLDVTAPAVREALLGPGLAHPNIIATYTTRVARIDAASLATLRMVAAAMASLAAAGSPNRPAGLRRVSSSRRRESYGAYAAARRSSLVLPANATAAASGGGGGGGGFASLSFSARPSAAAATPVLGTASPVGSSPPKRASDPHGLDQGPSGLAGTPGSVSARSSTSAGAGTANVLSHGPGALPSWLHRSSLDAALSTAPSPSLPRSSDSQPGASPGLQTRGGLGSYFGHSVGPAEAAASRLSVALGSIGHGSSGGPPGGPAPGLTATAAGTGAGASGRPLGGEASSAAEQVLEVLRVLGVVGPMGQPLTATHYVTAVVMEYADAGNLESFSLRPAACDTATAVDLLLQVARGMSWLHAHGGLVHGDLKPANVLLVREQGSNRLVAKVADFGLSGLSGHQGAPGGVNACGTVAYSAPEALAEEGTAEQAADVYSYGICMWQLAAGKRPYQDLAYSQILFGVLCQGMRPEWPTGRCTALQPLYGRCCSADPADRPTFDEVVAYLEALPLE